MMWEEFLDHSVDTEYNGQRKTDIQCPKCGRNIYIDLTVVLTSYPCKYHYWCTCGWTGCTANRWMGDEQE